MDLSVPVRVVAADDADDEELYDLTCDLEAELRYSDARTVTQVRRDRSAAGAKSSGAVSVGQLLVVAAPAALPGVIALIGSWLSRHRDQTIRVKVGEAEVEVPRGVSAEEVRSMVAMVSEAAAEVDTDDVSS